MELWSLKTSDLKSNMTEEEQFLNVNEPYFVKLFQFISEKSKDELHLQNTERGAVFSRLCESGMHENYLRDMLSYYISSANEIMNNIKPQHRKTNQSPTPKEITKSIISSIETVVRDSLERFEEEGGPIFKGDEAKKERKPLPPISHATMLNFKLNFLNYAKTLKSEFMNNYYENSTASSLALAEMEKIFNFLARTTYEFGNLVLSGKILLEESQDNLADDVIQTQFEDIELNFEIPSDEQLLQNAIPLKKPVFTNVNLFSLGFELMEEECPSMLYRIGGGTMREIVNVSKIAKDNNNYPIQRRKRERKLYNLGINLSCHGDEKFALPIDLRVRDNGNMSFPKLCFMDFLKRLNNEVRKYASIEGFRKFGTKMIKECKQNILEQMSKIWFLFCECLPDEHDSQDEAIKEFFKIWVRKLVNARIQEFISNHNDVISKDMKKLAKGGQTLRDGLYAAVTQTKKKYYGKGKNKEKQEKCDNKNEAKVENQKQIEILKELKRKVQKAARVPDAPKAGSQKPDEVPDSTEAKIKKCDKIRKAPKALVQKPVKVPKAPKALIQKREKVPKAPKDKIQYCDKVLKAPKAKIQYCDKVLKAPKVQIQYCDKVLKSPKVQIQNSDNLTVVSGPSTTCTNIFSSPTRPLKVNPKKLLSSTTKSLTEPSHLIRKSERKIIQKRDDHFQY